MRGDPRVYRGDDDPGRATFGPMGGRARGERFVCRTRVAHRHRKDGSGRRRSHASPQVIGRRGDVMRPTRRGVARGVARAGNDAGSCTWETIANVARVHQTLRVTPAMEAGIADHVWSIEEIVGLLEGVVRPALFRCHDAAGGDGVRGRVEVRPVHAHVHQSGARDWCATVGTAGASAGGHRHQDEHHPHRAAVAATADSSGGRHLQRADLWPAEVRQAARASSGSTPRR